MESHNFTFKTIATRHRMVTAACIHGAAIPVGYRKGRPPGSF